MLMPSTIKLSGSQENVPSCLLYYLLLVTTVLVVTSIAPSTVHKFDFFAGRYYVRLYFDS